jgi:hypothetical protein
VSVPGSRTSKRTNPAATMLPMTPSAVRVNRVRSVAPVRGRKESTIVALGPQNARARMSAVVEPRPRRPVPTNQTPTIDRAIATAV